MQDSGSFDKTAQPAALQLEDTAAARRRVRPTEGSESTGGGAEKRAGDPPRAQLLAALEELLQQIVESGDGFRYSIPPQASEIERLETLCALLEPACRELLDENAELRSEVLTLERELKRTQAQLTAALRRADLMQAGERRHGAAARATGESATADLRDRLPHGGTGFASPISSAQGRVVAMLIHRDCGREVRYPLYRSTLRVGRADICEIPLRETGVSRRHARLIVSEELVMLEDLGSKNGVYVNGQRVHRVRLSDGDELAFGEARLIYAERAR